MESGSSSCCSRCCTSCSILVWCVCSIVEKYLLVEGCIFSTLLKNHSRKCSRCNNKNRTDYCFPIWDLGWSKCHRRQKRQIAAYGDLCVVTWKDSGEKKCAGEWHKSSSLSIKENTC